MFLYIGLVIACGASYVQLDCCRVMSSFYDSEDERQRAVRTVLQNWLQCDLASLKIPTGKRRQPPVTDGTAYSGGNVGSSSPYVGGFVCLWRL